MKELFFAPESTKIAISIAIIFFLYLGIVYVSWFFKHKLYLVLWKDKFWTHVYCQVMFGTIIVGGLMETITFTLGTGPRPLLFFFILVNGGIAAVIGSMYVYRFCVRLRSNIKGAF